MSKLRPVVALIQARMGSSRLPGKVLKIAAGRSLLAHLVERLRAASTLDSVAIATSRDPRDDAIVKEADALEINVFRGSEADVLDRFCGAARALGAATIVRLTADCPLMDPAEVDRVVQAYLERADELDYLANQGPERRRGPLGLAVEVFSRAALEQAAAQASAPHEREHVTPFLYDPAREMRSDVLDFPKDLASLRLTVDTPEDLSVILPILEGIEGDPEAFALDTTLKFLRQHPALTEKNREVRQKKYTEVATQKITPKVALFRADASVEGGTGHVMRVLGLAQAWIEAGGEAIVVSAGLNTALAERFIAIGATLIALMEAVPGSLDDARHTRALAQQTSAGVVLVDGYGFRSKFLRELGAEGLPVVYVDDFGQPGLPVTAVLMPNAGARAPLSHAGDMEPPETWAGASFVPVRAEFRDAPHPARSFDHSPLRLLITFGGSDPSQMTRRAIDAALAVAKETPLQITVLLGPSHPDIAQLQKADSGVEVLHDVRDMAGLFARVDLALSAAGTTCWELSTLGVPMLLVPVADNQRVVIDGLVKAGAARNLPMAQVLSDSRLRDALQALVREDHQILETMSRAGRHLIDGQGSRRIAEQLAELAGGRS